MLRIVSKNWVSLLMTFCIAFSFTLVGAQVTKTFLAKPEPAPSDIASESEENTNYPNYRQSIGKAPDAPSFIDLQEVLDTWQRSLSSNVNVGIMIYDLDNQEIAGALNPDRVFNLASIYKLFFVYAGYHEIDHGNLNKDELYITTSDKGELTIANCLDLMVRESYNGCADPMRDDPEWKKYNEDFTNALKLTDTSNFGLASTARDVTELLKVIYRHEDLSEDSWLALSDSMLNQPATTDDWRQGLPSGFSIPLVYDKVGWSYSRNEWAIFNDAALLDFTELGRHYSIVVLTEHLTNLTSLHSLAKLLEEAITDAGNNGY